MESERRKTKGRGEDREEETNAIIWAPESINLSSKLTTANTALRLPFFWVLANLIKIYIQIRSKCLSTATNKKHWQIQPLILHLPKERADRINSAEILKPCVDTAAISQSVTQASLFRWPQPVLSSGPQPFWQQGPVLWKTIFSQTRGWVREVGSGFRMPWWLR